MFLRRGVAVPAVLLVLVAMIAVACLSSEGEATAVQDQLRGVCYHTDPSDWTCPDSSFRPNSSAVDSVVVSVYSTIGNRRVVTRYKGPAKTDAIFLSHSAVDNLLLRYYEVTRAEEKATALRRLLRARQPQPPR